MGYTITEAFKGFIDRIAIDGEEAIVGSTIGEYYLDNGALFNVIACSSVSLATNAKIEVEFLSGGAKEVRIMNFKVSTTSDEFATVLYELPKRVVGDIGGTHRAARIFQPNRINKKDCPVEIRYLQDTDAQYEITAWDSGVTDYALAALVRHAGTVYICTTINTTKEPGVTTDWEDDWDVFGSVVDIRHYLLEDSGGPQASDSGLVTERPTLVRIDTENYNYMFELENLHTTTDFGAAITVGVPELLA